MIARNANPEVALYQYNWSAVDDSDNRQEAGKYVRELR